MTKHQLDRLRELAFKEEKNELPKEEAAEFNNLSDMWEDEYLINGKFCGSYRGRKVAGESF